MAHSMTAAAAAAAAVAAIALGASVLALGGCSALLDFGHDYELGQAGAGGSAEPSASSAGGGTGGGSASASTAAGGAGGAGGQGGSEPTCGNGVIEAGEECDDGNAASDDTCDDACEVVCEGSRLFKDPATKQCYMLSLQKATWDKAAMACLDEGFYLASITSPAEMSFVEKLSNTDAWIGGNDLEAKDKWEWVHGEPWSYAPWESGSPAASYRCVELGSTSDNDEGTIANVSCTTLDVYLCERDPAGMK